MSNMLHWNKFLERLAHQLILPKEVLDAPLWGQVVEAAAVLRDLDLPGSGGNARPTLGASRVAQLEGQLVAAIGGLHVHC